MSPHHDVSPSAAEWVVGGGWARIIGNQPTKGIYTKQVIVARGQTRGFSQSHFEEMLRQQFGGILRAHFPRLPCQPPNSFSWLGHAQGEEFKVPALDKAGKNRDLALGQEADSCQLSKATCWTVRGTEPEGQVLPTSSYPSPRTGARITDSTGRRKEPSLYLSQVPQLPPPSLPCGLQNSDGYGVEVLSGVRG